MTNTLFKAIRCESQGDVYKIIFSRASHHNSLNEALLMELNQALHAVETSEQYKIIIFQGMDGYFCTGLDLTEVTHKILNSDTHDNLLLSSEYLELIKKLSCYPKMIISHVDGAVLGGGMGIIAVSDLVVATPRSRFGLPESLWGLLPACVAPYLIRKIGFQNAYRLALTAGTISAQDAKSIGLIDQVTDDAELFIEKNSARLRLLKSETVKNLKDYFRKMWIITHETEMSAIEQANHIIKDKKIQADIVNYVKNETLPWT